MDKDSAKNLIQDALQNSFDKERFIYFVKNLLNSIDESKAFHARGYVPEIFKDYVKTYERLGTYTDPEEKKIDILTVYLQRESTLDRARTAQRNFIARYLKDRGEKDAGLIAFLSPNKDDWRFSLVKMEYKFNEKGKVEEEFTPARRYSFLVGKNENSHTAKSRLLPLLLNDEVNPTLGELEETFSVERVTKEFFEKYRDLFLRLKESLDLIVKKDPEVKADFERKNVDTVDFAKKLLGQIVFLYFLQKKGWFGVPRGKDWGEGDKKFLRTLFDTALKENKNYFNKFLEPLFYEALRLERPKDYYDQFNCRIPFLNGGLFDPVNEYDWQDTDIEIHNEIFSNNRKTKEGDIGDGILDVFDRYNFTVKEDEPLEKEVAIDPEMLGKVFENLLEVKDRKSKGTYYTPREIVHYMCQESLANYLATELSYVIASEAGNLKEEIEILIKYGETVVEHDSRVVNEGRETKDYSFKLPVSIREHAQLIDEKLKTIRICDPAVGSGAFLVGMMNEVIKTRNALTPYIGKDGERTPYYFKRHAIQNCLYGVDIDPGAVDIAKLRLWLSLIVDEEDIKQIKPLPNLDYKIMQGNSLLSVEKDLFNADLFNKLENLKPLYFNETNASKKQDYRNQIDELISQITNGHKDFDFEVYFSEVFHEKGGFDIVIANPPYVRIFKQKQDDSIKNTFKKLYKSAYKDFDYYVLFFEKGLRILKPNGVLVYITPDKYLVREYGTKIREIMFNYSIKELFDLSRATDIFEAATYPLISIIQKNNQTNEIKVKIAKTIQNLEHNYKEISLSKQQCINNDRIEITDPEFNALISKIFSQAQTLSEILNPSQIFCGTPRAKDYHLWSKYIGEKRNKNCLRVLVCSNLTPYIINFGKKVRVTGLSISSPYFCNNDEIISKKRWEDFLFIPKILIRGNDTRITATLDEEGSVFIGIYGIKVEDNIAQESKTILACLNSKLYQWIFATQNPSIKIGGEFFSINSPHILRLPFKKLTKERREEFDNLVDKILAITNDDDYLENPAKQARVREYEKEIDQLVYKLYDLTPEEIKTVEESQL